MAEDAGNVKVFCRVRPPNEREGGAFAASMAGRSGPPTSALASSFVKKCIVVPTSDPLQQTVFLQSRHASSSQNSAPKTFTFDRAFGENATQNDVFEVVGVPITQACLQGYNGTIFAYGQTGSGKTFTMQGPDHVIDMDANRLSAQEMGLRGLVPRVFDYLFDDVVAAYKNESNNSSSSSTRAFGTNVQHTFACSFLEIYNERVYDLLDGGSTKDPTGLQLRENGRKGVFVEGLIESVVTNAKQAAELMTLGAQNRRVGQTAMNRESSRSHSVFILQIQSKETTADGITKMRSSRFNLVDLAGSERQRNTEAAGERLKEAGSINKSLSALGNVIMGLVEQSAGKNRHVHYRDSKLTFLLKDSLGGNSKTFMIATISPAEDSAYETLSTLKFAQRAKLIRNNAIINEDSTGSVLVLQEEIQRLRRQLHQAHVESVRMPHESSSLTLMQSSSMVTTEASASRMMSSGLSQHCDPAIDSRFRELEAAFATSIEKNSQLKRSYEHLKLQEEHLKALCTEMKRNITHMKMVLRLRQGKASGDDMEKEEMMMDYEPSVDAIEWRLKYEELEENFAELQDEIQQRRMAENFAGKESTSGHVEGEIENLNLMLLALTKQLAYVVRDKHELQDRLAQLTKTADNGDDAEMLAVSSDDEQKVAQLQQLLRTQAHDFNAKINALAAAKHAAEDKAREASFELLEMKQKEVAWKIQEKERDIRLQDAVNMLQQAEETRALADDQLKKEKQQHHELLHSAEQEREQMRLDLEARFADLHTSNQQLLRDHEKLSEEAQTVREERDAFEQKSKELSDQVAKLLSDLSESERVSSDKSLEIDSLLSNLTITNGKLDSANIAIQRGEELASELRGNVARLEAMSESLQQDLRAKNDDLSQLQSLKDETDRELSHSKVEASELKQQNSDVISELENVSAAFDKLKLSHGDLEMQLEKAESDIVVLKELESTLLNVKAQLEEKCEEGLKKVTEKQEELVKLADDHEREKSQLSEQAEATIQQLTAEYEMSLQEKVSELQRLQTSFDDAIQQSEQKQTALQKTHDERVLAMESAKAALEDDHVQTIAGLEKELGVKQNELEELTIDVSRLKNELEEIVSKANALEKQNAELQGIREAQHSDLEKSEKAIAALELLNSELTQTHDNLRAEVEERTSAIEELQKSKDELTSSRDELQAEVKQRELSIQKLSSEIEALNENVKAAKIREENLSNELEASIHQHAQAFEKHSLVVSTLRETHVEEMNEVKGLTEAMITELKEALSESERLVQAKEGDIAKLETELQALVAQHEAHKKEATQSLQTAEKELHSLKKNLSAKAADYLKQEQVVNETVRSLQTDVERANTVIKTQQGEIEASVSTTESLKEEIVALKKLGASQSAEHEAELKELHLRLKGLENRAEAKISQAAETEKEFAKVKHLLQTQLSDAEQKLKKQTHVSQELVRKGEQLELTVDDQQAQLKKSDDKLAAMAAELEQTTDSMRRTKTELSAKKTAVAELKRALVELQSKLEELEKENRDLQQDRQAKAELATRAEQLERHSAELEKKKRLVESELKDAEKEKQAAAATRKKLEAVRDDYQKCKMRLEELEPLVIQLKNDKKKLERETLVQSARLENISKENDKLVGHDNKRQKIQYHFKVKEENNRLLGEVRALTDEKFKLQTKLDKLKLVLKEKENFGEATTGLSKRPTPPSGTNSSAASSSGTTTTATLATKKLIPVSSGLGLESSSLAPPKANKKRLHSRIERS